MSFVLFCWQFEILFTFCAASLDLTNKKSILSLATSDLETEDTENEKRKRRQRHAINHEEDSDDDSNSKRIHKKAVAKLKFPCKESIPPKVPQGLMQSSIHMLSANEQGRLSAVVSETLHNPLASATNIMLSKDVECDSRSSSHVPESKESNGGRGTPSSHVQNTVRPMERNTQDEPSHGMLSQVNQGAVDDSMVHYETVE